MQIRFHKDDWSNYDETNDYSYKNPASTYADWDKINLYKNGILVWGQQPGGSPVPTIPPTTQPPAEPTPLPATPGPDSGNLPFTESGGMVVMEAENPGDQFDL